jgi:hypothetical protein
MSYPTYTAVFKDIAVTAVQDLFEVRASANSVLEVFGFLLSQRTEVGDAAEEQLLLTTNRGTGSVTSGSGGASLTVNPVPRGAAAFGGAVERNNTTILAVGTGTLTTDLEAHNWNVRVPYMHWYIPEARPLILPNDYWTLELETAPADSINISGTLWLRQLGV